MITVYILRYSVGSLNKIKALHIAAKHIISMIISLVNKVKIIMLRQKLTIYILILLWWRIY